MLKHILTTIFGAATLVTFFLPVEWTEDIWFNLLRVLIMLAFLGLLLSYQGDHGLSASVKKAPKSAKILMVAVPVVVLGFVLIQTLWPELAGLLVRKESWPFYRNAIFIKLACQLVAAVIFAVLAYNFCKKGRPGQALLAGLVVLVLIIMAGEEISWGQRIFGWATPEFFRENNLQGETNFHNLATQLFQNLLYFGGWLLLVALPFWRTSLKKFLGRFKRLSPLGDWLPPTYLLLIFAAAFGLGDPAVTTDTGWRYGSILFSLIATAVILIYLIIPARGRLAERLCLTLGVFAVALFFNLFVSEAWNYNSGVPTEYLELFINFGIMYWAIDLKNRLFPVGQRHH